ncbi:RBP1-like protein [Mya arenaria]|uniref:RBP1-like protein n=1 Tax=Mya arenaria TaxID=6604 RepID=A0ABY7E300_MYAAR|nr:RBP1-like protein [Mya arenaria]
MSATRDWNLDCKVYVGEIGYGTVKQDLEDVFSEYGPLKNVWVARNPPGFAFVEFEDYRDAKDAVDALDGTRINGRRARVEMSSGKSRWGSQGPPPRRGPRYGGGDRRRSRVKSLHSVIRLNKQHYLPLILIPNQRSAIQLKISHLDWVGSAAALSNVCRQNNDLLTFVDIDQHNY